MDKKYMSNSVPSVVIGKRIKDLRNDLELSQTTFALKLGRGRSTIANIEGGIIGLSKSIRTAICEKFNVCESWILTGEGEKFTPNQSTGSPVITDTTPARQDGAIYNNNKPSASACAAPASGTLPGAREFSIADDLMLAARVLESRTHYATALHLNIRSFAAGIEDASVRNQLNDVQARLRDLEDKTNSLQQENKILRTEVNRLKATYENPGEEKDFINSA